MMRKILIVILFVFLLFSCENQDLKNKEISDRNIFYDIKCLYVLNFTCENAKKNIGSKFSGTVTASYSENSNFNVGDEVHFENAFVCPGNSYSEYDYLFPELSKYPLQCSCHLFNGIDYDRNYIWEIIEIDGISYHLYVYETEYTNEIVEVNFLMNDGSDDVYKSIVSLKSGALPTGESCSQVNIRYIPHREGYVFAGWYENKECTGKNLLIDSENVLCDNIPILKSTNFYAKWIQNTSGYEVGDIVLKDGSSVPYKEMYSMTEEQKQSAIAVISFISDDGTTAYGLGLYTSDLLIWCTTGSPFHKIPVSDFRYLCGDMLPTENYYLGYAVQLVGDLDASDDWEYIKNIDTEGTLTDSHIEVNYPAWNFALTYGKKFDTGEQFQTGWFIPHWVDFQRMSLNTDLIEDVLNYTVGESLFTVNDPTFVGDVYYWTNSPAMRPEMGIYFIDPATGTPGYNIGYKPINYKYLEEFKYSMSDLFDDEPLFELYGEYSYNIMGKCNPALCRVMKKFRKD